MTLENIKIIIKDTLRLYKNNSFSQEGEDLILHKIYPDKKDGFYIDVGAHHPFRFSNTYYFYRKGWRGVNIDAAPESMKKFKRYRQNDFNIESAISDKKGKLTFYQFNDPALNTFDSDLAKSRVGSKYYIASETIIDTRTLGEILDELDLPHIDFMSIDVEGFEMQVLKSNDWVKYRPDHLLIEYIASDLETIYDTELFQFVKKLGYTLFAKTFNTLFFKRNE